MSNRVDCSTAFLWLFIAAGCSGPVATPQSAPAPTATDFTTRGIQRAEAGDNHAALDDLTEALERNPENVDALYYRGLVLFQLDRPDEALESFSQCIALDDQHAEALGARGVLHQKAGRYKEALADLQAANLTDPGRSLYANDLAWLLATCPDDSIRNGKDAVNYAALAADSGNRWEYADTMAAALAESGDFERAVTVAKRALEQCPPEAKPKVQRRLTGYLDGKPWRE